VLRGPDWADFLREMYGNQPARWDDSLTGNDRLRCIINALTRIR
jgi:bis(5'-nucleosyl)-tetraphosphatase (symmetrical)